MIQPGLYGERKLLGAKVKVISSPAYELFGEYDNERIYRLKKIEYRITLDGKLAVSFVLDGLENSRFLPEDLMVIELPVCDNNENDIENGETQEIY